jgi:RNA polymerase sigma factor (sigma-70 family)
VEPSERTDEELLRRIPNDPIAVEEFYRRHVRKITTFAVRRCATPEEVRDLVAAVWLEVIESAHRFNPQLGRAVPWLLAIASNLAASEARRRSREREAAVRLGGQRSLDEDDLARLEERLDAARHVRAMGDQLSRLPRGERAIADLVMLAGLSPTEAAIGLGISSATARMRLTRARKRLRQHFVLNASPTTKIEEVAP